MKRLLGVLGICLVAAPAPAAPTVDGTRDAEYGSALAVQTVQTQFGDNLDPAGLTNEGELDAGYATISGGRLYVMLTGNVGRNFNKLSVFIDSQPGGENTLDGSLAYDFNNVSQNFGGLTFDADFEADYHLFGRWGGGAFEVDIVNRAASTPGNELGNTGAATTGAGTGVQSGAVLAGGPATTNAEGGGFLTQDVFFGFNNTNIAGVSGGTAPANAAAAAAVTTGFEFSVALADIGNPGIGDLIKIHAAYGNGDNNFHSNQILAGLPDDLMNGVGSGTGNLGGDGNGGFTGNLSGIDFSSYAENQYFSIRVVPEPTSVALIAVAAGGLALARRRKALG